MTKISFILGISFILTALPASFYAQSGSIEGIDSIRNIMAISRKLCTFPDLNESVVKRFFDCYDQTLGKEQFFTCQREVYDGKLLDSVSNIRIACDDSNPLKLAQYASCVQRELDNAGLNQTEAITNLTNCQRPIFNYLSYEVEK